jgi:hypothetical protein
MERFIGCFGRAGRDSKQESKANAADQKEQETVKRPIKMRVLQKIASNRWEPIKMTKESGLVSQRTRFNQWTNRATMIGV